MLDGVKMYRISMQETAQNAQNLEHRGKRGLDSRVLGFEFSKPNQGFYNYKRPGWALVSPESLRMEYSLWTSFGLECGRCETSPEPQAQP